MALSCPVLSTEAKPHPAEGTGIKAYPTSKLVRVAQPPAPTGESAGGAGGARVGEETRDGIQGYRLSH